MSSSAYDIFLDEELEKYYEDAEEDVVDDDDWLIDQFIEHEIEMENYYD